MTSIKDILKISDTVWEIPSTYKAGMRVPARIYATEKRIGVGRESLVSPRSG